MSTYAELMEIIKANEIRGYSHYTKSELIDLLIKKGLICEKYDTTKQEKAKKDLDPKYYFLRPIRSNSKMLRYMICKQIRLFFILPYAKLRWPWIKIPELLVCIMEKGGGTGMRSKC